MQNISRTFATAGVSLLAEMLEAMMFVEGARGVHQLWPQALAPPRGPQSSVLIAIQEEVIPHAC